MRDRMDAAGVSADLTRVLTSKRFQGGRGWQVNRHDNSHMTVIPHHVKDPLTGQVHGIKYSACRACGHVKIVSVASGLCGTQTCLKQRRKRAERERAKRTLESLQEAKQ